MSNTIIQKFQESEIRSIVIDGEVWFVAKDVCKVLEIKNSSDAISDFDADQKGVAAIDTLGGPQMLNVINKSGAYTLALKSRKPEAKKFQRWITDEVVPSIEKTGSYGIKAINFSEVDMSASSDVALMLIQAGETIIGLNAKVKAMTPDYEFGNELKSADNLFTATEIAKELGATAQCLNGFLKDKKVIFKHKGCWVPYSAYDSSGFFKKVNTTIIKTDSGESFQKHSLKITAKGQEFVHRLWREHKAKLHSNISPGLKLS